MNREDVVMRETEAECGLCATRRYRRLVFDFGGRAPNCTTHFAHEKFEKHMGGHFMLSPPLGDRSMGEHAE